MTHLRARAGDVSALLILCVFPLAFHDYSGITRYKYLLMLLLTPAVVFLTLISHPGGRGGWTGRVTALCLLGWMLLSALTAPEEMNRNGQSVVWYGAVRYEGMISQACYLLLLLCFSFLRVRHGILLEGCGLALTVFMVITGLQYLGVNALDLYPQGRSIRTNYEFQGTLGNIDMVSGYLMLMIPLLLLPWLMEGGHALPCFLAGLSGVLLEFLMEVQSGMLGLGAFLFILLGLFLRRPVSRWRIMVCLGSTLLLLAFRRSLNLPWLDGGEFMFVPGRGLVPFLLAIPPYCAWPWLRRHPGRELKRRQVCLILAVLFLLLLAVVYFVPLTSGGGLYEIREVLHGRGRDEFGSWRLGVWRYTLEISREHLLLGTGPDTFLPVFSRYLEERGLRLPETFDNPHNLYLALMSNTGIVSLFLYLLLVGLGIARCLRAGGVFPLSLASALLLYALQGCFSFSICLVSPMAFALLGMAFSPFVRQEANPFDHQSVPAPPAGAGADESQHAPGADGHPGGLHPLPASADGHDHESGFPDDGPAGVHVHAHERKKRRGHV